MSQSTPAAGRPSTELPRAGGATLAVATEDVLASSACARRLALQVGAIVAESGVLAVRIIDPGGGAGVRDRLRVICALLGAALRRVHAPSRSIQITLSAGVMSPGRASAIRRDALGPGRINLLADDADLRPACTRDGFWLQLWQRRGQGELLYSEGGPVAASCPLLAAERADAVEPSLALQAPAGSAWVWSRIRVDAYANARGEVDRPALAGALENCLTAADALHDETTWPTPAMRHDSWRNRRVAIFVLGFGEIVVRRRRDPRTFACFDEIKELLEWMRRVLTAASRRLAHEADLLPALCENDPTLKLAPASRADWQDRWRRALETTAVRHRNLIALSPWSMMPAAAASPGRYLDLLALLASADVTTFLPTRSILHYGLNDFIELHRHSRRALRSRDATRLIAEHI